MIFCHLYLTINVCYYTLFFSFSGLCTRSIANKFVQYKFIIIVIVVVDTINLLSLASRELSQLAARKFELVEIKCRQTI